MCLIGDVGNGRDETEMPNWEVDSDNEELRDVEVQDDERRDADFLYLRG